jgi:hypothetical protein
MIGAIFRIVNIVMKMPAQTIAESAMLKTGQFGT